MVDDKVVDPSLMSSTWNPSHRNYLLIYIIKLTVDSIQKLINTLYTNFGLIFFSKVIEALYFFILKIYEDLCT